MVPTKRRGSHLCQPGFLFLIYLSTNSSRKTESNITRDGDLPRRYGGNRGNQVHISHLWQKALHLGLQYIEAGGASLIIALNPLAITLCAAVFLHEKLGLHHVFGILISLIGAIFVISNGHPGTLFSGNFGRGELAILGCVASWVAYSIIGKGVLQRLSPQTAVLYSSMIGTTLLFFPALTEHSLTSALSHSTSSWISLVLLGIFGTAVGFSLYYRAIRKIGPTTQWSSSTSFPLLPSSFPGWSLGETIRPTVLIDGILLLGGASLTNSQGRLQMLENIC